MSWSAVTLQRGSKYSNFQPGPCNGRLCISAMHGIVISLNLSGSRQVFLFILLDIWGDHIYALCEGKITESLWKIVCDIIYGISVIFALLNGITNPFDVQKLEAIIEKDWEGGVSKHLDRSKVPESEAKAYYLAYCFQPSGNIRDEGTTVVFHPAPSES